VPGYLF